MLCKEMRVHLNVWNARRRQSRRERVFYRWRGWMKPIGKFLKIYVNALSNVSTNSVFVILYKNEKKNHRCWQTINTRKNSVKVTSIFFFFWYLIENTRYIFAKMLRQRRYFTEWKIAWAAYQKIRIFAYKFLQVISFFFLERTARAIRSLSRIISRP